MRATVTNPPNITEAADPLGFEIDVPFNVELPLGCGSHHLQKIVATALGRIKPARKPYKPRRPPLDSLLKQAAKADKNVKGAEVYPDRTVLQFGEPTPVEPDNPWPLDEFRTKETKQ